MIHDAPRHRVIVSGGFLDINLNTLSDETWALSLTGERVWTKLATSATSANHGSGIYDPVRDRIVVFDGVQVTALALGSPSSWTTLATTGTPPSGGGQPVYDPSGDRMIVLTASRNTYALSFGGGTPAWSQLTTTGTGTGGISAAVILDPVRNRLIATIGGTLNVGVDVFELPLGTLAWHKLSFSGLQPAMRVSASAIYDPNADRMMLFAGEPSIGKDVFGADQYYGALNDTWALSLSGTPAWTPIGSGKVPQKRWQHTAIYDPDNLQMVVFGGNPSPYLSAPLNDTWTLPLTGPTEWSVLGGGAGGAPSARLSHSSVYDLVHNRMIMFGGYDSSHFLNDTWVYSLNGIRHWEQLAPSGTPPSARYIHSAVWDAVGNRMILFGGFDGSNYLNDVWALSFNDGLAWVQLAPDGTPPDARAKHSAVLDPVSRQMLVFGGETSGGTAQGDLWSLDLSLAVPAWSAISAGGAPGARTWHTAVYDAPRERMLIVGGHSASNSLLRDVWCYSGSGGWTDLTSASTPKLYGHAAAIDVLHDRMLVYAGDDGTAYPPTTVYAMPLAGTAWQTLNLAGSQRPPGTFNNFFTAIYDAADDQAITFGGSNQGVYLSPSGPWQMTATRPLAVHRAPASGRELSLRVGPQPSHGVTAISFELPSAGETRLDVFDVNGRCVKTLIAGPLTAGRHDATWAAPKVAGGPSAGVYFVRLQRGSLAASRKLVLSQ